MNSKAVFEEIKSFCQANADPGIVKKYSRYFKEGYQGYGLGKGLLENKIEEILGRDKPSIKELTEVAKLLVHENAYEMPSSAIYFFMKRKKEYSKDTFAALGNWFELGIENWAHSDAVCMELLKNHINKNLITPEDIAPWRFSERKYKRRASLVTMIYFMKNGLDPLKVIDFTDPLMMDTERVVHQGAGWLLRETWKKHPAVVEDFLLKWKDQSPRLIFQYATEKMTKEGKERFRREK
jgi:3-methyladenine DNA glycosylase AlkD